MNDDDAAPLIAMRALQERLGRFENDMRAEIRESADRIIKSIEDFKSRLEKTDPAQVITDWRLEQLEKRVATIESRPS
jgi:hypothetical protein